MWMLSHGSLVSIDTIKEFNTDSPRTTAIVGAVILEDCLARVIGEKLPIEGETKRQLFKANGGPLGNLDAKVKVAYAMGILSKQAFQDIIKLVEIMNKFAHRLDIATFDHQDVRGLCFELRLIEKHLFPMGSQLPEDTGLSVKMSVEDLSDRLKIARDRYLLSVMLLHSMNAYVQHPDNPKPRPPRPLI